MRAAVRQELERGTPPLEVAESLQLEKYQDVPFYDQYFSQNVQAILFDQLLGPIGWRPQRFYPQTSLSSHLTPHLPSYQPSHEMEDSSEEDSEENSEEDSEEDSKDNSEEDSEEDSKESSKEEVWAGYGGGNWSPVIID